MRKLKSGDVLAKPVFGLDGRTLLQAGVSLTSRYIVRLEQMGFRYVYIQDSETYDVMVEETLPPEVQQEVLSKVKRIYDKMSDPKRAVHFSQSGTLGREFVDMFKLLIDTLSSNRSFVISLSNMYASDAYLYTHCMNVGVMATLLGLANGFDEDRIKKFGLGALLHDIGKLQIDRAILDKPGALTPEERVEIERHCELGYQFLVRQPDISLLSAHCALQHHEKFDGTGYPRRLKGNDIHEFGRLLAVPDVYDALTSNRVYRKALLPHEAVEFLYAHSNSHFDPQFTQLFLRHINIYPNGLPVQLSDRSSGVIARANPSNLQRPVVLVLEQSGQKVVPFEIDLLEVLNVTIVGFDLDDED